MESSCILVIFLCSIILIFYLISHKRNGTNRRHLQLPPCPPSLPLIGHLHLLCRPLPHRTLRNLANKYGDILGLSLGSRYLVVVSSPVMVEECFTKQNDTILANRPTLPSRAHIGYDSSPTVVSANYGQHWRHLRKLFTLEIFSQSRLDISLRIREEQVKVAVKSILGRCTSASSSSSTWSRVDMKSIFGVLIFNSMLKIVAGDIKGFEEVTDQLREVLDELFRFGVNPADYLPILKWISYKNHEKELKKWAKKLDELLQGILDQHRNRPTLEDDDDDASGRVRTQTVISNLLILQKNEPEAYADEVIKGIIMVMIGAGTDTSLGTTEWAMSLLLNHPSSLSKAKAELDVYVGVERMVQESDLPKLTYLKNIITETLRLYPAAPLLIPHLSSQDITVGGYDIPRDSIVLANAWAIHRDPSIWDDPESFRPERFENNMDAEERQSMHRLIPFGLGRRACPGISMAYRMVGLALATLIQCFEWKRTGNDEVNMSELSGLSMSKAVPLEAMCKPRTAMIPVLSGL